MFSCFLDRRIVSIEGNIGSGKTTLFERLKKNLVGKNVIFVEEPVDLWESIRDSESTTILQKFYSDPEKYSFSFQTMAFFSRLFLLQKALASSASDTVIVTERSLLSDRAVFAKMLYDSGKIEDINYQIYLHNSDAFLKTLPLSGILYLKTDPKVCEHRIANRNRPGEASIELLYLEQCSSYHNSMISGVSCPVLPIDGNQSFSINNDIEGFILGVLPEN
jgi:deoxyadenosine/deoxycytidine kinase